MQRFTARLEPVPHGGHFVVVPDKVASAAGLAEAAAAGGDRVKVTIEIDDQPLPTDTVPDDLARAIAAHARAAAAWERLSPAHKREHVKHVTEAKKPETRARRIAKAVQALRAAPSPRARASR